MLATTKFPAEQESRIEWWGRVILRQETGRIPLAQFCRQLGITTRKFYYWRQRLRKLNVAGSGKRIAIGRSPRSTAAPSTPATFVPVSILGPRATTQLEVELANGCTVRVTGPVDPGLLQAAITAAGQLNGSGQGDR
jgi:hypothetical protein